MSDTSRESHVIVVDSVPTLLALLDQTENVPTSPPSLFLDLEGVKLGRHSSISIISLYVASSSTAYLVDVHCLGKLVFETANSHGTSLKSILESSTIPKVIFDVRNDTDALYSEYQISVNGMKDLQLMELATRRGSKDYVAGLAKCIERDGIISATAKADWKRNKDTVIRLLAPDRDGRYEVLNERPLRPELVQYCTQDVALLPGLYDVYAARLRPPSETFWRVHVEQATQDRIKLSQSTNHDGHASSQACRPWDASSIERDTEVWNDDVMMNAMNPDSDEDDLMSDDLDDEDEQDYWDYGDTAQDCIGWEEDMEKNGEFRLKVNAKMYATSIRSTRALKPKHVRIEDVSALS